jgi:hypothetical protein
MAFEHTSDKGTKTRWFKIMPLLAALSLSACNKPVHTNDPGMPAAFVQLKKPDKPQLYRLCKDGWIVIENCQKMYEPNGGDDRWPIAPSANEDKICTDGEPE